jgi:MinD-like ATPase involved in chromosome partitioning or flagellar assembly
VTGHVVTFYSYKGGVGRSMTLANVAYLAAAWGRRVLCIDWDLEAPGLDRYLALTDTERAHPGLVDAVLSVLAGHPTDWRAYVQTTRALGVPIDVLHAGRRDAHYLRSMQSIDWTVGYRDHDLGGVLDRWRDEAAAVYDLVLIDSRTGVTDTGSICAAQLPDTLVVITTPNEQSLEGTLQIVQAARQVRNDIPWERQPMHVVPIVSRLEKHVEHQRTVAWWGRLEAALSPLTRSWCHAAVEPAKVLELLRIPHIAYWSFGEEVAAHRAGWQDPDDVGHAAATLTALLLQRLVGTELLVRSRDAYVGLVDPGPADRFPIDVFVLHGLREASLAEEVVAGLRAVGLSVSSSSEELDDPPDTPWLLRARHCVVLRTSDPIARRVEEDQRRFEEAVASDPRRRLVSTDGDLAPILAALRGERR